MEVKAQDFHLLSIFQQLQWNPDLWLAKRERQTILQKEKSRIFHEGLFGIGWLSLLSEGFSKADFSINAWDRTGVWATLFEKDEATSFSLHFHCPVDCWTSGDGPSPTRKTEELNLV